MILAGIAAAASVALPYVNTLFQPNLFGTAYSISGFFSVEADWTLGIPLGFIVIAMALCGVLLGVLASIRRGGRGIGALAIVMWLGLGGAAAGWWYGLFRDVAAVGAGAIVAGAAVIVGLIGAIVVAATRHADRSGVW